MELGTVYVHNERPGPVILEVIEDGKWVEVCPFPHGSDWFDCGEQEFRLVNPETHKVLSHITTSYGKDATLTAHCE